MNILSILAWLLIGVFTGLIVGWFRGRNRTAYLQYSFYGILGAFLSGFLSNLLGISNAVSGLNLASLLAAIIGALLLDFILGMVANPILKAKTDEPAQTISSDTTNRQPPPVSILKPDRQKSPVVAPESPPGLPTAFADLERQANIIKKQLKDGILTAEEGKQRLSELMIEDTAGNWWMVGLQSGNWYRYDGAAWVRDNPPRM